MAVFKVCLTGYFSQEIDVEVDESFEYDDAEIGTLAADIFYDEYQPVGQWAYSWDSVEIDSVEEAK